MSQSKPVMELEKSVKALESKEPHIHSLRFPNYRNLQPDSELPFDFPITILLGQNGTNKSSILHALYGSPYKKTVADFWFETKLDAIPETKNGRKQSIIHRYKRDGEIVECIKARAPRKENPDYWEPVRHSKVYGLPTSGTRIPPIALKVLHLDFRGELPAFDKYFYFPDPKHLAQRERDARKRNGQRRQQYRKQDYLRSRSTQLKKEIELHGQKLEGKELNILRYILQRNYISGKFLKHTLFHGHEGWTILFQTQQVESYSDAFAGSGESAAALLVHNVLSADSKTLILLDEPETSLHPRAQQRMLEFIADQAVKKDLQIVITTHSKCFAERLPQKAIRVLSPEANGVVIQTNLSINEAFHEISNLPSGKTILVEDKRAQSIVFAALALESNQVSKEFKVIVRSGGTSKIYRDIQAHANSGKQDTFVILDGDHNPQESIPTSGELPQGTEDLENLIKRLTKGNNTSGPDLKFFDNQARNRYIEFLRQFVRYLPGETPEQLVWDDSVAKELLGSELLPSIQKTKDYKRKIHEIAANKPGLDDDTVFRLMLSRLLENHTDPRRTKLIQCVRSIRI
ncbi:MAG: ATP-dependent endonuclease [Phormidesmis sp.]